MQAFTGGKRGCLTVLTPSEIRNVTLRPSTLRRNHYDPTPDASGNNYWLYPTQSDTVPTVGTANTTGVISNPGANVANYNVGADWNSQDGNLTTVGSAAANNYFGTADQGGNVWEWNDAIISGSSRGLRGGAWAFDGNLLRASVRNGNTPKLEFNDVGFRVASVPEPSAVLLISFAVGASLTRRRRFSL